MSYDVYLRKDGRTVQVDRHVHEGGTFVVGGSNDAELNITYNYGKHFAKVIPGGLRALHNQKAGAWIVVLEKAVETLGTKQSGDYWESTPGNAGHALSILLRWAKQHPDATFIVH